MLRQVFAAPEFRWRETPDPLAWVRESLRRVLGWLSALYHTHPGVYFVVLAALVVVAVAILVHLGHDLVEALRHGFTSPPRPAAAAPAAHDAAWHEAEARRLGAAGRFAEAIGHRYLALMLLLAGRRAVVFHPSKTPAEYAAEAKLAPGDRGALQALTATLYAHLFGGEPCDADAWARFDRGATALGSHGAPA